MDPFQTAVVPVTPANSAVYAMKNIAIPAYNEEDELYSKKLSKLFKATEPLCYEDIIGNVSTS